MKPVLQVQTTRDRASRKFPLIDFNYRAIDLDDFNTHCSPASRPSFATIGKNYFKNEAHRTFAIEFFLFALITALTLPAVIDCGRAALVLIRTFHAT